MTRRFALGIDIGGSGLKVGLIHFRPEPVVAAFHVLRGHGREDPPAAIERLVEAAHRLLASEGLGIGDLAGVGVGCAGLVDLERGVIRTSPNLPAWREVPIREALEQSLARSIRVANDAESFLAAEWRWGAARGAANALFVALGTGVGGGLVLNGSPYRGATGLGGEIGHMSLDLAGPLCPCGNRGCLEMYVGKAAIEREAVAAGLSPAESSSPARVAACAASGDGRAVRVYQEIGRRLGTALAGLVNLLDPEVVVVGGGVAAAGDLLLEPTAREMNDRSMVARQKPVLLTPAHFGPQAGMVGAALLAAEIMAPA